MVSKRPIYQDVDSIWAERKGVYVRDFRKEGIDVFDEAVGIATLILYEYYGPKKTWDHDGNVKPMTLKLARLRLRYIYPLAKHHGADRKSLRRIKRFVRLVAKKLKIPKRLFKRAKRAIVNIKKLRKSVLKKVFA